MELKEGMRIIDYIIEQAEVTDGRNLNYEHKVLHSIEALYDKMSDRVLTTVGIYGDMRTTLQYQSLVNKIDVIVTQFSNDLYRLLVPAVEEYFKTGQSDFADLIEIGHEVEDKVEKAKIGEIKGQPMIDPNALEYVRKHAYEYVVDVSNNIMMELRTQLSAMMASGNTNPRQVSKKIREILDTKKSRADMIAQTELSMAYNNGALNRMDEFNQLGGPQMRKYWHGFKYSQITCTYCRPRIGNVYDINDHTEVLPAHPRCRCVWLPMMDGWDKPIPNFMTRNTRMINRVYSPQQVYDRINKRLGINYASYLTPDDAQKWLRGDRSEAIKGALVDARDKAVKDIRSAIEVAKVDMTKNMAKEYKTQMSFWKDYVSKQIVDNDADSLDKAYDAIKGVMILPWNAEQLKGWNDMLEVIRKHL